jgi:hypothetical protein
MVLAGSKALAAAGEGGALGWGRVLAVPWLGIAGDELADGAAAVAWGVGEVWDTGAAAGAEVSGAAVDAITTPDWINNRRAR